MTTSKTGLETPTTDTPGVDNKDGKDDILYLGMDLGTSRTSVAASNGVRETVASFVG